MIRNADQTNAILEAGKNGPGKVDVLVESLDDIKSDADAQRILDKVKPDWVVWSAGVFAFSFPLPVPFSYIAIVFLTHTLKADSE